MSAILKTVKRDNLQSFDTFSWNIVRRCISAFWTSSPPNPTGYQKFKILKIEKMWYLQKRLAYFDEILHGDAKAVQKFQFKKYKMAAGCNFETC